MGKIGIEEGIKSRTYEGCALYPERHVGEENRLSLNQSVIHSNNSLANIEVTNYRASVHFSRLLCMEYKIPLLSLASPQPDWTPVQRTDMGMSKCPNVKISGQLAFS